MNEEPILYSGYKIFHFGDSFEHSFLFSCSMYLITSYVITKNDEEAYEFFFGVSTMESALHGTHLEKDELVEQSLEIVKSKIDEDELTDREKYVYQYYFEGTKLEFRAVTNPVWMTEAPR